MPSRASGFALSAAIRCAVSSISEASIGRPLRSRISRFAAAIASGPPCSSSPTTRSTAAIELLGRHHLVHQPDPRRLCRADPLAREHQPPGMAQPDRGEHVRPDHRRDQAKPDLGRAEGRLRARHHDVAAGDQAGAAAERGAVHPGDGRLRQLVQGLHQPGERPRVGQILRLAVGRGAAHPVEVRPGREAPTGAGQDQDAHAGVGTQILQLLRQLGDQPVVEGVVDLRAVERQPGDALGAVLDAERSCGHGTSSIHTRRSAQMLARTAS